MQAIADPNLAASTTREVKFGLPASCESIETGIKLDLQVEIEGADVQVITIVASVPEEPAPTYLFNREEPWRCWPIAAIGGLFALTRPGNLSPNSSVTLTGPP